VGAGISRVIEDNQRPGFVFVDVGANVGYDSLVASQVGSGGGVAAIEASPRILALLQENLDRNPQPAPRRVREDSE
jgi:FkbM family methyltransferase